MTSTPAFAFGSRESAVAEQIGSDRYCAGSQGRARRPPLPARRVGRGAAGGRRVPRGRRGRAPRTYSAWQVYAVRAEMRSLRATRRGAVSRCGTRAAPAEPSTSPGRVLRARCGRARFRPRIGTRPRRRCWHTSCSTYCAAAPRAVRRHQPSIFVSALVTLDLVPERLTRSPAALETPWGPTCASTRSAISPPRPRSCTEQARGRTRRKRGTGQQRSSSQRVARPRLTSSSSRHLRSIGRSTQPAPCANARRYSQPRPPLIDLSAALRRERRSLRPTRARRAAARARRPRRALRLPRRRRVDPLRRRRRSAARSLRARAR